MSCLDALQLVAPREDEGEATRLRDAHAEVVHHAKGSDADASDAGEPDAEGIIEQ